MKNEYAYRILLIACCLVPNVAGFAESPGEPKLTLSAPAGEITSRTPKLQWKMDWAKESNPQPSPSPQRPEFKVMLFQNAKKIWESSPVPAEPGRSYYELQLPEGIVVPTTGPGEDFVWQVVAHFHGGTTADRKIMSEKKALRLKTIRGK